MSHEMVVLNELEEEVAYIRFSMGNPTVNIVYDLLDAQTYNGGVSGIGQSIKVPYLKLVTALDSFAKMMKNVDLDTMNEFMKYQLEDIEDFFEQSAAIAKREKSVTIVFC